MICLLREIVERVSVRRQILPLKVTFEPVYRLHGDVAAIGPWIDLGTV